MLTGELCAIVSNRFFSLSSRGERARRLRENHGPTLGKISTHGADIPQEQIRTTRRDKTRSFPDDRILGVSVARIRS